MSHIPCSHFEIDCHWEDTLSSLLFEDNLLIATSYDGKIYPFQISTTPPSLSFSQISPTISPSPIISAISFNNLSSLFTGHLDGYIRQYKLKNDNFVEDFKAGIHYNGTSSLDVYDENNIVSCGYDNTVRYWDIRSPQNCTHLITLPSLPLTLSSSPPLCMVCTNERHLLVYDVRRHTDPWIHSYSPLKFQIKCSQIISSLDLIVCGSIGGELCSCSITKMGPDSLQLFHQMDNTASCFVNDLKTVIISANLQHLYTAGSQGGLRCWQRECNNQSVSSSLNSPFHPLKAYGEPQWYISHLSLHQKMPLVAMANSYEYTSLDNLEFRKEKEKIYLLPLS